MLLFADDFNQELSNLLLDDLFMCLDAVEFALQKLILKLLCLNLWMGGLLPVHEVVDEIHVEVEEEKKLSWDKSLALPSPD